MEFWAEKFSYLHFYLKVTQIFEKQLALEFFKNSHWNSYRKRRWLHLMNEITKATYLLNIAFGARWISSVGTLTSYCYLLLKIVLFLTWLHFSGLAHAAHWEKIKVTKECEVQFLHFLNPVVRTKFSLSYILGKRHWPTMSNQFELGEA